MDPKYALVLGLRVISSTRNIIDLKNKDMIKYVAMILIKESSPPLYFSKCLKRGAAIWTIN